MFYVDKGWDLGQKRKKKHDVAGVKRNCAPLSEAPHRPLSGPSEKNRSEPRIRERRISPLSTKKNITILSQ